MRDMPTFLRIRAQRLFSTGEGNKTSIMLFPAADGCDDMKDALTNRS